MSEISRTAAPLRTPLFVALLGLMVALGTARLGRAQSGPLEDLANFPRASLDIFHGKGKSEPRHFQVWIADSPNRQEQGLMFVRDLPASQGMIFPEKPPRPMSMWMKNTYVELDLVFIGEKGEIDQIIEHAHPLSLQTLSSEKPVAAVLEIKGGEAARQGLKVGDRVVWTPAQ
jgi:uncharacterized membrane protein (UPF0127 family)